MVMDMLGLEMIVYLVAGNFTRERPNNVRFSPSSHEVHRTT